MTKSRKAELSAQPVHDRSLFTVESTLRDRTYILAHATDALQLLRYDEPTAKRLAAADLFVEKAQAALTQRSRKLYWSGAAITFAAVILLGGAIAFAFSRLIAPHDANTKLGTQDLILAVFQALAFSAFIFVAVKYLIALSRSFFHEATHLLERRHALRFGRLWLYQNPKVPNIDDMMKAFNWNKETTSAFLDIRPEVMTRTIFNDVIDALAKLPTETASKLIDAYKEKNTP